MTRRQPQPGNTPSLDEVAAERLLRGFRPTVGASSDEQAVAKLLAAASAPPSASELSGEARAVAAYTATRPATTGPRHARHALRRPRLVLSPRVGHGVAAAAALGALTVGGMAAAAYTGSLPGSIQRLAHDHIGAPQQHRHHTAAPSRAHPTPTQTALRSSQAPKGGQPGLSAVTLPPAHTRPGSSSRGGTQPTSGPRSQRFLLCNAYTAAVASGKKRDVDAALRSLEQAAGGADRVLVYCAPVWHPGLDVNPSDPLPSGDQGAHPPRSSAPARPPN